MINEYYHTVVIATEKLSNSKAKPRCYDKFEGNNNRVVIFLINTCCNHFKIEHSFIGFSFLFLWTITFSKVSHVSSDLSFVLSSCPPPTNTHTHTHAQTHTHTHTHTRIHTHGRANTHTHHTTHKPPTNHPHTHRTHKTHTTHNTHHNFF